MNYYCDTCDKTIIHKSKTDHLKSLTHMQYETSFRMKYTIKNPNFFDVEKLFNNYVINHNKKFVLYLVKCDFKLFLNNDFTPYIKTAVYHNTLFINLERCLLYWIECFIGRGHKFYHNNEMNITIINDKMKMTYEYYNK